MAAKRSLDDSVNTGPGLVKKTKFDYDGDEKGQELRILIANHEAGAVIGKGGAKVNSIRSATQCTVSILKNENPVEKERVLVLRGSTEGNALAIQMMVGYWIEASNYKNTTEGLQETVDNHTVRMLVHKALAGAIIGKGGARIREFQSETGAHIQLSNEALGSSTEKTVSIKGTQDQIYAATTKVLAQLRENPLNPGSVNVPYAPGQQAFAPPPPSPYGGYAPPSAYGGYPPAPYGNPYGEHPQHVPQHAPQHAPHVPSPYGAPSGYGGQSGGDRSSEKIVIPALSAGAVIGKGGSRIRDINSQTGANISIAKPEASTPHERVVTITGPAQSIQSAIYMIHQCIGAQV